jgi:hypothetical protein
MGVTNFFIVCPQCKQETLEVIKVGDGNMNLSSAKDLSRLYETIRQAAYAECETCGKTISGDELVDFMERTLLEEEGE